jgi:RNA polymerase sigma-70 factor, ECF subfamily
LREICGVELGLSAEEFAAILQEICERYLPPHATEMERAQFCRGLQLEDLKLARACAKGSEIAWERFVTRYRPKLNDAALAIVKEESRARELADSLYAELFGTRQTPEGGRISKFASYTGRGSLEGWLRTLLAQEYVNQIRRERRSVAFEERMETRAATSSYVVRAPDPRLTQAIDRALAEISAEERLILASYYLDNRTLAETGRMLGVHESTISRRLDKITQALRKRILHALRRMGMSEREAREALDSDVRDLSVDVRSRLVGEKIARSTS